MGFLIELMGIVAIVVTAIAIWKIALPSTQTKGKKNG